MNQEFDPHAFGAGASSVVPEVTQPQPIETDVSSVDNRYAFGTGVGGEQAATAESQPKLLKLGEMPVATVFPEASEAYAGLHDTEAFLAPVEGPPPAQNEADVLPPLAHVG
jgi:hypothetical protein